MPDREAERNKEIREGLRLVAKAVEKAGSEIARALRKPPDPRRVEEDRGR